MTKVKIVQIAVFPGTSEYLASLVVLDDKNRLWIKKADEDHWTQLDLPEEPETHE